jgi:hypothetical protein
MWCGGVGGMYRGNNFEHILLDEVSQIRNMLYTMCFATYNVDENDEAMVHRRFEILLYSLLSSRTRDNTYSITFPYLMRCFVHQEETDLLRVDLRGFKIGMHGYFTDKCFAQGSGFYKFRITMKVSNPTWDIKFNKEESTGRGTSNVLFSFSEFEFTEPLEKSKAMVQQPLSCSSAQEWFASFREVFHL